MAIRLQGGFTSTQTGSVYVINIYDDEYASTVIDFDVLKDGVVKGYDHQEKGRNLSIMTSKLKIKMLVKNSDIKSFLTDVVAAPEGRFLVEVLKDGNKDWYGYILPDLLDLEDIPFSLNPVLTISATDGIGRLKSIDYNNAGTAYSGQETFLDHLYNVLGKIGFNSFYAASEDYLVTYVDWWDTNHTYLNTDNPYELARFNHKALIEVDSGGETVFQSAYDVLEQLVKAWNCRFLFSNGAYHLVQINAYETDAATKVLKKYDKDKLKATTSTTDFDIWNYTTGSLSGYAATTFDSYHNQGRFRFYPALRKVEVQYEHFSTDNLIPGQTWTQATAQTATYNDIDYNSGNAALQFTANVSYRADWYVADSELQVMTYWFQFQIIVGTYYLSRPYTLTGGKIIEGNISWTTSPAYYNYFPSVYMYSNNSLYTLPISFPTPPLQEGGQLSVTISRAGAYNSEGQQVFTGTSNFTPYYTFSDVNVSILVEGNLADQTNIKVYTATNDDGSSNSELEKIPVFVGDGPSGNTFGHIEIYNGATWENSTDWRKGNTGTYAAFGQLLANEVLAGQKYAVERYIGTVTGGFEAHGRLQRDNGVTVVNYVFIGGSHNLHKDIWNGEWFQIDIDETGITEEVVKDFIDFSDFVRGGPTEPRTPNRPGVVTPSDGPDVVTHDSSEASPVQIGIDGFIPKDVGITSIPVDVVEFDDWIHDGDTVVIVTPTGEEIEATVDGDVEAGDTTITVDSVTPDVDIPEGSVVTVPLENLLTYVQTSRKKSLKFLSDIRVVDPIIDGEPLFFFRIDPNSRLYSNRITSFEVQVHTPGSGSGNYDYELKKDGVDIVSTNTDETTVIDRTALSHVIVSGLYTLHISNITGTIPKWVNFCIDFLESLQTFAAPTITILFAPVTTVYEVGTSNAVTISGVTTNPSSTTLSNGELNRTIPTPETSINSFGAGATYSQGITFTPQQGGSGNYNELDYSFQATQDYAGTESGTITSQTKSLAGVYPVLYGLSATDLSSSGDVYATLTKLIEAEGDKTVNMTGSGYIYYAVPKTWSDFAFSQILDHNGFDVTMSFTAYDRTVSSTGLTNDWVTENYKLYKLNTLTDASGYDYQFIR